MAKSIRQQIADAWRASGLTQHEIIQRAGLPLTQPALSRRLSGDSPLSTGEAEALARVLKIRIYAGPKHT